MPSLISNPSTQELEAILRQNKKLFAKTQYVGLPGVLEFEGEFYPPSRLHHLEKRLGASVIYFDKEISSCVKASQHSVSSYCGAGSLLRSPQEGAEAVRLFYR